MTSNKEISMKPILFSTPMVKALLNTKPGAWPAEPIDPSRPCKSQTRRVVKPQPEYNFLHKEPIDGEWFWTEKDTDDDMMGWWPSYDKGMLPRYQVGDKLWVRETWLRPNVTARQILTGLLPIQYKADFTENELAKIAEVYKWCSPSQMPRKAARLFLEVREVRVERLQDITEADAIAEGVLPFNNTALRAKGYFEDLWNSINGKGAWESNPWVWVYEFMRVEG